MMQRQRPSPGIGVSTRCTYDRGKPAWKPEYSPRYCRDRPAQYLHNRRPNFEVQLRSNSLCRSAVKVEIDRVISKLTYKPGNCKHYENGHVLGYLHYQQWVEALETMVQLWEMRLEKGHLFTPWLIQNVGTPSDKDELMDRLKGVFLRRLERLFDGEMVKKWEGKAERVSDEVRKIGPALKKGKRLKDAQELIERKEGLVKEGKLIAKRVEEFRKGVQWMVDYLKGKGEEDGSGFGYSVGVFKFGREIDWEKIHSLMVRECRRLDDGLPIFTSRTEILDQVHHQQVTVLTGETGSGKSTQLVQFLADSGIADSGSIICTQPRKLAAITLADRVREESSGCYGDGSVISIPSYSSGRHLHSKVIFMTDHCLLQYYMSDKKLSKVSCIIIDEAHERSLNTDLLLAMIKKLLCQRLDLRLIIMSATADADQLANYFFGCGTIHVTGRNFPVDIRNVPNDSDGRSCSAIDGSYLYDVVKMAAEIHRTENEGTILAFVTSQIDVEWACGNFHSPCAIALPLHGKLTFEEQRKVFLNYPGKRKVIFATNVAETSLTIPGVKYVVDSGMVKESKFDPGTGMNVLKLCSTSQSSAKQRAGRAGRTEPGRCYRLYSENDFELMPPHQEPEIRRVHLGIAVLRILALGIKNVQDFDYVDAPSPQAIAMATRNLVQLGAVTPRGDVYDLTTEGYNMVKLGIEPRLGKIILDCFHHRLGWEGVVLAAVVANSSSIFCRVGTMENKLKSDCLKVQFCHNNGDPFTLLAVYKEWEAVDAERKNIWCWENSINAKSMRRCQEAVKELEGCLQNELNKIIPSYWRWNPRKQTEYDETLKGIILSAFSENVAMYSGYDHLGYEVALTGKHVKLHPSCSLLAFDQRPTWIVFKEILSASYQYLVCASAFDSNAFATLSPPPLFDFRKMDSEKLERRVISGFGSLILKRFCGKGSGNLNNFISHIRTECLDDRIGVEVNVEENEVHVHATSRDMEKVRGAVNSLLEYELRLLQNECLEKCLFSGNVNASSSVALFGAGAEIRHLELEKRGLTVDIFHSHMNKFNDKDLLMFLERSTSCAICAFHKFTSIGQESKVPEDWIRVTFLSPDAAKRATELNQVEFSGGLLTVNPSRNTYGGDAKLAPFSVLKSKVCWPRRVSKGIAIVKCRLEGVAAMVSDFNHMVIGENYVRCERSTRFQDSVVLKGIHKDTSEDEIFEILSSRTSKEMLDVFLLRGESVEDDPRAREEELLREISPFMPKQNPLASSVRVQVFQPEPKDTFMRAAIMFDSSLHLEAAMALDHLNGKALLGCLSWQKMKCQHLFHSSVSCPEPVYKVIRYQLDNLVANFCKRQGVECNIVQNENRTYRVNISATATKIVAELRRPLEELMKGTIVDHAGLTPTVLQQLFSRDGANLLRSIPRETGTYILFDRHALCVKIFGPSDQIEVAKQRLVESLVTLQESKQLQVNLRGGALPPDMMKQIVQKFGPELHGLKEMFPGSDFSLDAKRHCIYFSGMKDLKPKVQDVISEISQASGSSAHNLESACPICLCEVEDGYKLEHCRHEFCRSCLVEQCESAIKSQDSFPLCCAQNGCTSSLLLADLRSLLPGEKFEELFRASLAAFVTASVGRYRFCPSPDCPTVYEVSDSAAPYLCGACYVETCRCCHLEYHQLLSCEQYKQYKADPDLSLKAWSSGKENVKKCPGCGCTIEKTDGCNHISCKCGKHVCWVCLDFFNTSEQCYEHLGAIHHGII